MQVELHNRDLKIISFGVREWMQGLYKGKLTQTRKEVNMSMTSRELIVISVTSYTR